MYKVQVLNVATLIPINVTLKDHLPNAFVKTYFLDFINRKVFKYDIAGTTIEEKGEIAEQIMKAVTQGINRTSIPEDVEQEVVETQAAGIDQEEKTKATKEEMEAKANERHSA